MPHPWVFKARFLRAKAGRSYYKEGCVSEAPSVFAAYAAHPSLGEDPARGRLFFQAWRLKFESTRVKLEMPLTRLEIDVDRSEGIRVKFSEAQQPDWLVYTFDSAVLASPALLQQVHTRRQVEALQGGAELNRRLKLTLGFLAGFALVALVASLLMGVMVRSLVARIPAEWEHQLGTNLVDEVQKQTTVVNPPNLRAKLDQAATPLLQVLPTNGGQFKFYIIQESVPNAFALPGANVFVTTGLLEMVDRPEELAGVFAHEIAHVTLKHGFRKIISEAGPYLIFKIFLRDGGGLLGVLGNGSRLLISQSFSQKYKLEADSTGWDYLVQARIDPRGMVEVLTKFKLMQDNEGGGDMRVEALESHPATAKRIQRLEAKWAKLKEKPEFLDLSRPAEERESKRPQR